MWYSSIICTSYVRCPGWEQCYSIYLPFFAIPKLRDGHQSPPSCKFVSRPIHTINTLLSIICSATSQTTYHESSVKNFSIQTLIRIDMTLLFLIVNRIFIFIYFSQTHWNSLLNLLFLFLMWTNLKQAEHSNSRPFGGWDIPVVLSRLFGGGKHLQSVGRVHESWYEINNQSMFDSL